MKKAFTLIELIFVIVIIGLLAAVAVPKFLNLKQHTDAAVFYSAVADLNGSGGASTYLNLSELEGLSDSDINMTNLYKFNGNKWVVSKTNPDYVYYNYKYDDNGNLVPTSNNFRGAIRYDNNGIVEFITYCNTNTDAGKAYSKFFKDRGITCDTSTWNWTYSNKINLATQN